MRRSQRVGTKYIPELDAQLDRNQDQLVDLLITPRTRIDDMLGAKHQIVAKVAAYTPDAQPTQARGRIVWNEAYRFQNKGPSYLDGTDV